MLKGEADYKPWSGWWWPKTKGQLVLGYNGQPSPAEKYDLYVSGIRHGSAYWDGIDEWYDINAKSWHGLCNGWVNASILEPGPILPASSRGVFLGVGDKKGLLAAAHFKDEIIWEKCAGPEPFHRYLIKYVGEQGEIIGADLDSSDSFWSYPIYSYEMAITPGIESDEVICTIKHADDFVEPDYQGTLEIVRTYKYRLDKDAQGNYDGAGEWLEGDPEDLHPEYVWVPVGIRQREIIIDYAEVVKMARTVDDELEGEGLLPGHHLLIVYPGEDDTFTISPLIGEKITCSLALDPQSAPGNGAHFTFARNSEVVEAGELDPELQQLTLESVAGGDQFRLAILPDLENSAGVCVHLYVEVEAQYQSWFYGYPGDSYWLGYAAAGLTENPGARAWLEVVGDQGLPWGRGAMSGADLKSAGQWLASLENYRSVDYFSGDGKPVAFKLISSTPLQSLLLAGNNATLWGPPNSAEVVGGKLIIPWLTSVYNWSKSATFYLTNSDSETGRVTISYYKNDGTLLPSNEIDLPAKSTQTFVARDYPGIIGGVDGWGIVESSKVQFSGAVIVKEGYKTADQLPLLEPAKVWFAPHLATGSGWQTRLGICNPEPELLTLSLTAYIDGEPIASIPEVTVVPYAKQELVVSRDLLGLSQEEINRAWLRVEGDHDFVAYLQYLYGGESSASIPLSSDLAGARQRKLSQLAVSGGWWTGIVLINPEAKTVNLEIAALDSNGNELQRLPLKIGPQGKFSASVAALFNESEIENLATLRLEGASGDIKALVIYGGDGVTHLSAHSW